MLDNKRNMMMNVALNCPKMWYFFNFKFFSAHFYQTSRDKEGIKIYIYLMMKVLT